MKLKHMDYEITCIAPVHIGNGTVYKAYEYLYDKAHHQVLFLNEAKWIAFLAEHGLMDPFAAYMEDTAQALTRRGNFTGQYVWEWLRGKGVSSDAIRRLALRTAKASPRAVMGKKNHLNDVAVQAALADGRPYIPGSSIKGVLRTAILWRYLCNHPEQARRYWNGMRGLTRSDRNSHRAQQAQVSRMEQDILHVLQANAKKSTDAVNSAMRGLRVSDAVTDARGTIILQKIDESMQRDRFNHSEKELPLFRECIPAGTKLRFSMTADFSMLAKIGVTSFADIIDALRAYTQDALRWQESAFGKKDAYLFREADAADALLGGGTGFLSKTLVRALAQDERQTREFITHFLDANFQVRDRRTHVYGPAHDHVRLDHVIAPRTLKLAKEGQETWILGLCQIQELQNAADEVK